MGPGVVVAGTVLGAFGGAVCAIGGLWLVAWLDVRKGDRERSERERRALGSVGIGSDTRPDIHLQRGA